jgi:hypothetical protein
MSVFIILILFMHARSSCYILLIRYMSFIYANRPSEFNSI